MPKDRPYIDSSDNDDLCFCGCGSKTICSDAMVIEKKSEVNENEQR